MYLVPPSISFAATAAAISAAIAVAIVGCCSPKTEAASHSCAVSYSQSSSTTVRLLITAACCTTLFATAWRTTRIATTITASKRPLWSSKRVQEKPILSFLLPRSPRSAIHAAPAAPAAGKTLATTTATPLTTSQPPLIGAGAAACGLSDACDLLPWTLPVASSLSAALRAPSVLTPLRTTHCSHRDHQFVCSIRSSSNSSSSNTRSNNGSNNNSNSNSSNNSSSSSSSSDGSNSNNSSSSNSSSSKSSSSNNSSSSSSSSSSNNSSRSNSSNHNSSNSSSRNSSSSKNSSTTKSRSNGKKSSGNSNRGQSVQNNERNIISSGICNNKGGAGVNWTGRTGTKGRSRSRPQTQTKSEKKKRGRQRYASKYELVVPQSTERYVHAPEKQQQQHQQQLPQQQDDKERQEEEQQQTHSFNMQQLHTSRKQQLRNTRKRQLRSTHRQQLGSTQKQQRCVRKYELWAARRGQHCSQGYEQGQQGLTTEKRRHYSGQWVNDILEEQQVPRIIRAQRCSSVQGSGLEAIDEYIEDLQEQQEQQQEQQQQQQRAWQQATYYPHQSWQPQHQLQQSRKRGTEKTEGEEPDVLQESQRPPYTEKEQLKDVQVEEEKKKNEHEQQQEQHRFDVARQQFVSSLLPQQQFEREEWTRRHQYHRQPSPPESLSTVLVGRKIAAAHNTEEFQQQQQHLFLHHDKEERLPHTVSKVGAPIAVTPTFWHPQEVRGEVHVSPEPEEAHIDTDITDVYFSLAKAAIPEADRRSIDVDNIAAAGKSGNAATGGKKMKEAAIEVPTHVADIGTKKQRVSERRRADSQGSTEAVGAFVAEGGSESYSYYYEQSGEHTHMTAGPRVAFLTGVGDEDSQTSGGYKEAVNTRTTAAAVGGLGEKNETSRGHHPQSLSPDILRPTVLIGRDRETAPAAAPSFLTGVTVPHGKPETDAQSTTAADASSTAADEDSEMMSEANRPTAEEADRWTLKADRRIAEQADRRTAEQADRRTAEEADRWTAEQAERRTAGAAVRIRRCQRQKTGGEQEQPFYMRGSGDSSRQGSSSSGDGSGSSGERSICSSGEGSGSSRPGDFYDHFPFPVDTGLFQRQAQELMKLLGLRCFSVSVQLLSDQQMLRLNWQQRHQRSPTDVLCFPSRPQSVYKRLRSFYVNYCKREREEACRRLGVTFSGGQSSKIKSSSERVTDGSSSSSTRGICSIDPLRSNSTSTSRRSSTQYRRTSCGSSSNSSTQYIRDSNDSSTTQYKSTTDSSRKGGTTTDSSSNSSSSNSSSSNSSSSTQCIRGSNESRGSRKGRSTSNSGSSSRHSNSSGTQCSSSESIQGNHSGRESPDGSLYVLVPPADIIINSSSSCHLEEEGTLRSSGSVAATSVTPRQAASVCLKQITVAGPAAATPGAVIASPDVTAPLEVTPAVAAVAAAALAVQEAASTARAGAVVGGVPDAARAVTEAAAPAAAVPAARATGGARGRRRTVDVIKTPRKTAGGGGAGGEGAGGEGAGGGAMTELAARAFDEKEEEEEEEGSKKKEERRDRRGGGEGEEEKKTGEVSRTGAPGEVTKAIKRQIASEARRMVIAARENDTEQQEEDNNSREEESNKEGEEGRKEGEDGEKVERKDEEEEGMERKEKEKEDEEKEEERKKEEGEEGKKEEGEEKEGKEEVEEEKEGEGKEEEGGRGGLGKPFDLEVIGGEEEARKAIRPTAAAAEGGGVREMVARALKNREAPCDRSSEGVVLVVGAPQVAAPTVAVPAARKGEDKSSSTTKPRKKRAFKQREKEEDAGQTEEDPPLQKIPNVSTLDQLRATGEAAAPAPPPPRPSPQDVTRKESGRGVTAFPIRAWQFVEGIRSPRHLQLGHIFIDPDEVERQVEEDRRRLETAPLAGAAVTEEGSSTSKRRESPLRPLWCFNSNSGSHIRGAAGLMEPRLSVQERLPLLFLHAVLHALGFDHEEEADREAMQLVEEVAFAFFLQRAQQRALLQGGGPSASHYIIGTGIDCCSISRMYPFIANIRSRGYGQAADSDSSSSSSSSSSSTFTSASNGGSSANESDSGGNSPNHIIDKSRIPLENCNTSRKMNGGPTHTHKTMFAEESTDTRTSSPPPCTSVENARRVFPRQQKQQREKELLQECSYELQANHLGRQKQQQQQRDAQGHSSDKFINKERPQHIEAADQSSDIFINKQRPQHIEAEDQSSEMFINKEPLQYCEGSHCRGDTTTTIKKRLLQILTPLELQEFHCQYPFLSSSSCVSSTSSVICCGGNTASCKANQRPGYEHVAVSKQLIATPITTSSSSCSSLSFNPPSSCCSSASSDLPSFSSSSSSSPSSTGSSISSSSLLPAAAERRLSPSVSAVLHVSTRDSTDKNSKGLTATTEDAVVAAQDNKGGAATIVITPTEKSKGKDVEAGTKHQTTAAETSEKETAGLTAAAHANAVAHGPVISSAATQVVRGGTPSCLDTHSSSSEDTNVAANTRSVCEIVQNITERETPCHSSPSGLPDTLMTPQLSSRSISCIADRRVSTVEHANMLTARKYKAAAAFLAGRFAAKEALCKALGGAGLRIRSPYGVSLKDMEIYRGLNGQPLVRLLRKALTLQRMQQVTNIYVSIAHDGDMAVATATAVGSAHNNSHSNDNTASFFL